MKSLRRREEKPAAEPLQGVYPASQFDWAPEGVDFVQFHSREEAVPEERHRSYAKPAYSDTDANALIMKWRPQLHMRWRDPDLKEHKAEVEAEESLYLGIMLPVNQKDTLHMVQCAPYKVYKGGKESVYEVEEAMIICSLRNHDSPFTYFYTSENEPPELMTFIEEAFEGSDNFFDCRGTCVEEEVRVRWDLYIYFGSLSKGLALTRVLGRGGDDVNFDNIHYVSMTSTMPQ